VFSLQVSYVLPTRELWGRGKRPLRWGWGRGGRGRDGAFVASRRAVGVLFEPGPSPSYHDSPSDARGDVRDLDRGRDRAGDSLLLRVRMRARPSATYTVCYDHHLGRWTASSPSPTRATSGSCCIGKVDRLLRPSGPNPMLTQGHCVQFGETWGVVQYILPAGQGEGPDHHGDPHHRQ
jgi:hypothetical protein